MSDSANKFIKRNRPPRVMISYADPYDAEKLVELPFIMGVMADLSGNASDKEKSKVGDREMVQVDTENFEGFMASVEPGAAFTVKNTLGGKEGESLGIKLKFKSMNDFDPGEIAKQVPAMNTLLEARSQLANLARYMNGKSAAQEQLKQLLADPKMMEMLGKNALDADGDDK